MLRGRERYCRAVRGPNSVAGNIIPRPDIQNTMMVFKAGLRWPIRNDIARAAIVDQNADAGIRGTRSPSVSVSGRFTLQDG